MWLRRPVLEAWLGVQLINSSMLKLSLPEFINHVYYLLSLEVYPNHPDLNYHVSATPHCSVPPVLWRY